MQRETFVTPSVVALAHAQFIPVMLESDRNPGLSSGFGVSGLPASFVVSQSGKIVGHLDGFADAASFRAFLERSLARAQDRRIVATVSASNPIAEKPKVRPAPHEEPKPTGQPHTEPTPPNEPHHEAVTASAPHIEVAVRNEPHEEPARASKPHREPTSNAAPDETETELPVAIGGNCPVALVLERRMIQGSERFSASYDGRIYRFANAQSRERFLKNPEAFVPADGGHCPVSLVDLSKTLPGDPRFGVLYAGRLFLCTNEQTRQQFLARPKRYENADLAEHGFCPHCRHGEGLMVRGVTQYALVHKGQRYLFPDSEHREAFRLDPERYLR
jgi:YHS domain-containing protein